MFTPNVEPYISILKTFAANNANRSKTAEWVIEDSITGSDNIKTLPSKVHGIVPVNSPDFIYDYTLANPNATQWGVTFNQTNSPTLNIQYQIWFNSSAVANSTTDIFGQQVISFVRGLDEAIISQLNQPGVKSSVTLDYRTKDWPTIPASTLSDGLISSFGPTFFFSCVMFIFINVLSLVVTEKELKLRQGMEIMGLLPSSYWVSHYISQTLLVLIASLLTVLIGIMFQFEVFLHTHFAVAFLTFFLFGEAMVAFAFFITTLVRRSQVSVLTGIFMFIIGLLFEFVVFNSNASAYIWWDKDTSPYLWKSFVFLPFFNFGKIFFDMTSLTTGKLDLLTGTYIKGPGFDWSSLYSPLPNAYLTQYGNNGYPPVPPPIDSWYWLLINTGVFFMATWIFDNIIPDEFGRAQPIYFIFSPNYWGISFSKNKSSSENEWIERVKNQKHLSLEDNEEAGVRAERNRVQLPDSEGEIKLINLHKKYGRSKTAVRSLSVGFSEGQVLALLGQNGAGKSTTINMLSGMTPPSGGDALVYGLSIKHRMTEIRKLMGVCPQHDILFEDLTAREHIQLYAGLKGVPNSEVEGLIKSRLTAVRLLKVENQRAGTYSGGMKRRLSLVISTLGDPKVVFL
ncbi:ATP-binding cassette sub- A member 1, partial [Nowakowskiella sp. JEL0078]